VNPVLRQLAPPALAVLAAFAFDLQSHRAGLVAPGFVSPARRYGFLLLLALVFGFGIFASVATIGETGPAIDFAQIHPLQLFALHLILLVTLFAWYTLGFVWPGTPARFPADFRAQLGLKSPRLGTELAIGILAGVGSWIVVILVLVVVGLVLYTLRGPQSLPQAPPDLVVWIAHLPVPVKVAIALSAGLFEELFFRGLLQPRMGLVLTTVLFAVAHLSYDQPLMLVGVTLLSVIYGLLVRWRQSLWAAIVAHALFDGIQLLVVIPAVLRFLPAAGTPAGG